MYSKERSKVNASHLPPPAPNALKHTPLTITFSRLLLKSNGIFTRPSINVGQFYIRYASLSNSVSLQRQTCCPKVNKVPFVLGSLWALSPPLPPPTPPPPSPPPSKPTHTHFIRGYHSNKRPIHPENTILPFLFWGN